MLFDASLGSVEFLSLAPPGLSQRPDDIKPKTVFLLFGELLLWNVPQPHMKRNTLQKVLSENCNKCFSINLTFLTCLPVSVTRTILCNPAAFRKFDHKCILGADWWYKSETGFLHAYCRKLWQLHVIQGSFGLIFSKQQEEWVKAEVDLPLKYSRTSNKGGHRLERVCVRKIQYYDA